MKRILFFTIGAITFIYGILYYFMSITFYLERLALAMVLGATIMLSFLSFSWQEIKKAFKTIFQSKVTIGKDSLSSVKILRTIGTYAFFSGVLGSLINGISILMNLEMQKDLGESLTMALLPFFQGLVISKFVLLPLAIKVERKSEPVETLPTKNITIEKVSGKRPNIQIKLLIPFVIVLIIIGILSLNAFNRHKEKQKIVGRIYSLQKEGLSAFPILIEYLRFKDCDIQGAARYALIELGEPVIPMMINLLADESISREASITLASIGKPAIPALINALKDENYWVRAEAAWSLGVVGDKSTIPYLEELEKKDNDEFVRNRAKSAIEMIYWIEKSEAVRAGAKP